MKRIKWNYIKSIKIPESLKLYLWEYQDYAPLEILILRTLTYGSFEDIKKFTIYILKKTYKIALKYSQIKRGIKYWIERWKKKK
ncbi:MAG: hypothetical protein DRN19_06095 [Thermoplasmata archaeon]|nr:MAG: hypothetical protein DRN19_06095 [Thermoplasmata archaeon]